MKYDQVFNLVLAFVCILCTTVLIYQSAASGASSDRAVIEKHQADLIRAQAQRDAEIDAWAETLLREAEKQHAVEAIRSSEMQKILDTEVTINYGSDQDEQD